jgi:hypothetical protein
MHKKDIKISYLVSFFLLIEIFNITNTSANSTIKNEVLTQQLNYSISGRAPLPSEPVDVVYTYVQPDPDWQERKEQLFQENYNPEIHNIDCNVRCRFQNRNELQFSIRSVQKFLPFVRNIYIVTDNQTPAWYEKDAFPNIKIIDHKMIFPIEDDLPTFNSHSIEANLHRIPGLSENFIYLNDDVFIGEECSYEDFLDPLNRPKIFLDPCDSKSGEPTPSEIGYRSAWKNTNALLNRWFSIEKRKKTAHAPFVINRRIINKLWALLEAELLRTSAQKFRSIQDYSLVASIYPYFSMYLGEAVESEVKTKTLYLQDDIEKNLAALEDLKQNKYKFFCLEDSCSDLAMDGIVEQFLVEFFADHNPA